MKGILLRTVAALATTGALLSALEACNGTTSSTPNNGGGNTPPPRNSRIYVTDANGNLTSNPNSPNRIDVFTISSILSGTGSGISPIAEILSGSFSSAFGVAVDSNANIYVTDQASSSILVFHNNANGSGVAPFRTITSSAMVHPAGIALDGSNNVYVTALGTSSGGGGSILEFSATQSGNVAPTKQISGGATGLSQPSGIAVRNGNIFVANNANNTVEVFLSTAQGNSPPARVISGAASGLNGPFGVALDSSGNVYVSNAGSLSTPGNSITVYAPGNGSTPIRTISGSNTTLAGPTGLALDGNQNLWVSMFGPPGTTSNATGAFAVFRPAANGNVTPLASVTNVGVAAWGMAVY